jgi:flap endonuclease-1
MGVNISEIVPKKEIEIKDLRGKTIAIDAYNTLYQFLTTIRQPDGTPLQDKSGNITSHLSGLFYRNINLLQEGIKPVYVFDGKPPELKLKEIENRKKNKEIADEKFIEAKRIEDKDAMRKYSSQTVRITEQIITESKELLEAMGIPVIFAPSEGEAEAATLSKKGKVWACASQDYDSLLYAAPILIRNLTLARRRKSSSGIYIDVKPEIIKLDDVLNKLGISLEQLICLAILVGTDYNLGGVKGLGQKRALEHVKQYQIPQEIFKAIEKNDKYELNFDWNYIFAQFYKYESDNENIIFQKMDEEKIRDFLLKKDFSIERINSGIEKIKKTCEEKKQKGLGDFF